MNIELVKELRAKTHFGMADCKNALAEADGDLAKAIEVLQKKGLRKLDTVIEALEGEVRAYSDGNLGSIVEVNCQTDFAARSEPFQKFMSGLWTEARKLAFTNASEVKEERDALSASLREVVQMRRVDRLSMDPAEGMVYAYNHPGGRISVLVTVKGTPGSELNDLAEHVAMHIAATNPTCIFREEVPVDLVQKQRELFTLDLPTGKKPEQLEKILEGKMNRWFGENVLMEQKSVVTPDKTIAQVTGPHSVREFRRFERGESLK